MLVQTPVRRVVRLGNPVLRAKAQELTPKEIADPAVQRLIDEMAASMDVYVGVGIAAPQVGEGISLFLMGLAEGHSRFPPGITPTVVFNPRIKFLGDEQESDWEGCLSVPGMRGQVARHLKLELSGLDRNGKPFARLYEGFPARVVQHETDHLLGRVYLDRMKDLDTLSYTDEIVRR